MNQTISVIVAAYNAEQYIIRCIDSLRSQTYEDLEIIVVVDGGTDGTLSLCLEKAREDRRIVVIAQENNGPGGARNSGLQAAKGEYIAFVDADDYVEKDYLQVLQQGMTENASDLSMCGYIFEEENGREMERLHIEDQVLSKEEALDGMLVPVGASWGGFVWNKLYKASIIRQKGIRFPEEKVYVFEDILFNYRYIKHIQSGCYTAKCCYHYVKRDSSMMRNVTKDGKIRPKWFCYTEALDRILEDTEKEFASFHRQIKMMKVWHCATAVRVLAYFGYAKREEYKRMYRYIRRNLLSYLVCPYISAKKKLGAILTVLLPKQAYRIWRIQK